MRLLKLHPLTSPSTNQRIMHKLKRHSATDIPNIAFKNLSLKVIREFRSPDCELLILIALHPAINTVLSFTTTQCQQIAVHQEKTQVQLSNNFGNHEGTPIPDRCLDGGSSQILSSSSLSYLCLTDSPECLLLTRHCWPISLSILG